MAESSTACPDESRTKRQKTIHDEDTEKGQNCSYFIGVTYILNPFPISLWY